MPGTEPQTTRQITITVDGVEYTQEVEASDLLVHVLRDTLQQTQVLIGCDTGNCGACSVLWNGRLIKSCMMLAVQADGAEIATVASLSENGQLADLQQSFSDNHALQCGYCTPGMLLAAKALLERTSDPSEEEIRTGIKGNICRCTGYVNIVKAIQSVAGS